MISLVPFFVRGPFYIPRLLGCASKNGQETFFLVICHVWKASTKYVAQRKGEKIKKRSFFFISRVNLLPLASSMVFPSARDKKTRKREKRGRGRGFISYSYRFARFLTELNGGHKVNDGRGGEPVKKQRRDEFSNRERHFPIISQDGTSFTRTEFIQ